MWVYEIWNGTKYVPYVRVLLGEYKQKIHYFRKLNWQLYYNQVYGKQYIEVRSWKIPFTQWWVCMPRGYQDWMCTERAFYWVYEPTEEEEIEWFLEKIAKMPEIPEYHNPYYKEKLEYIRENTINLWAKVTHKPILKGEKYDPFLHDYVWREMSLSDFCDKFIYIVDTIAYIMDFFHNIRDYTWTEVYTIYAWWMRTTKVPREATYEYRKMVWEALVWVWGYLYFVLEYIIMTLWYLVTFSWWEGWTTWWSKAWAKYVRHMGPLAKEWEEILSQVPIVRGVYGFIPEGIHRLDSIWMDIPYILRVPLSWPFTLINNIFIKWPWALITLIQDVCYHLYSNMDDGFFRAYNWIFQIKVLYFKISGILTCSSFPGFYYRFLKWIPSAWESMIVQSEAFLTDLQLVFMIIRTLLSYVFYKWWCWTIILDQWENEHTYLRTFLGNGRDLFLKEFKKELDIPYYWMTYYPKWRDLPVVKQAEEAGFWRLWWENYLRIPTIDEVVWGFANKALEIEFWFRDVAPFPQLANFCRESQFIKWFFFMEGYVFLYWNFVLFPLTFWIISLIVHAYIKEFKKRMAEEDKEREEAKSLGMNQTCYKITKMARKRPFRTRVYIFLGLVWHMFVIWFNENVPDMTKTLPSKFIKPSNQTEAISQRVRMEDEIRALTLWGQANQYTVVSDLFNERPDLVRRFNRMRKNVQLALKEKHSAVEKNYNMHVRDNLLYSKNTAPIAVIERALLFNTLSYAKDEMDPRVAKNWTLVAGAIEYIHVYLTEKEIQKRKEYLKENEQEENIYDQHGIGIKRRKIEFYDLANTKPVHKPALGARTDLPFQVRKSPLTVKPDNTRNRIFSQEVADFFEDVKYDGVLSGLFIVHLDDEKAHFLVTNQEPKSKDASQLSYDKKMNWLLDSEKFMSTTTVDKYYIFTLTNNMITDQLIIHDAPDSYLHHEASWTKDREL